MNILFVTQSGYLQLFYLIEQYLRKQTTVSNIGYYVSNRKNYIRFLSQKPKDWPEKRFLLSEWDILEEASRDKVVNGAILEKIEKQFGDSSFWNVLLCDRRIFYGAKSVFTQDYTPRYSHDEMLIVLEKAFERISAHMELVKPDAIISFINVTFGEYLYYLMAKKLKIPYLNLRNTKIGNYLNASSDIFEPSKTVRDCYKQFSWDDFPTEIKDMAENFIKRFEKERVSYEGQDYLDNKEKLPSFSIKKLLRIPVHGIRTLKDYYCHPEWFKDNQPNLFIQSLFEELVKPVRARKIQRIIKDRILSFNDLKTISFAFYPLHLEPEISLMLYGRPYINQIEIIRMFALSLPVNWKLVIKEHPKNPYYRKPGYYKKLMEIPNVCFVPHHFCTYEIIKRSKMVVTLLGFVGFEALCQGKPVAGLGCSSYEFLPENMYLRADDPKTMGEKIHNLLTNYKHQLNPLKHFAASVAFTSVPFDWFSIGKSARNFYEAPLDEFPEKRGVQASFEELASYILKAIQNPLYRNHE